MGFTFDNGKFHSVSLGQGQEVVAEAALDQAAVKGHWVILQVSTSRVHCSVLFTNSSSGKLFWKSF